MSTYATSIWDPIRFEILNAFDKDTSTQSLALLKALVKSLSFGLKDATPQTPLGQFLKTVLETCIKEIRDPEGKSALPAGKILSACASVSPAANSFVVSRSVPTLIAELRSTEDTKKRSSFLEILNGLLDATSEPASLEHFKDDLFQVYSKGFLGSSYLEAEYKIAALEGLKKLCGITGLLTTNEVAIVVQYLNDAILHDENEDTWYPPVRRKLMSVEVYFLRWRPLRRPNRT
jgi:hypothetical protein